MGYSARESLDDAGTQSQARTLARHREFATVVKVLLVGQPDKTLAEFIRRDRVVTAAIQQTGFAQGQSPQSVFASVAAEVDGMNQLIANLYDASPGSFVVVPDTNALLFNPCLEEWAFDGVQRFTVVLLPTVLGELDKLKVTSRDDLRKKAEGVITRIKGYRGRGRLNDGVPLRKGVSTLLGWAEEPTMSESLPWLDATNADDRLLANTLEVMRRYPRSVVLLVTRDINLQNKAEPAHVGFAEPPDLVIVTPRQP